MKEENEKKVSISESDIKTYYELKDWISRNCDLEKSDIDDNIVPSVIDELCRQVKESKKPGSGIFCHKLVRLKGRINNEA